MIPLRDENPSGSAPRVTMALIVVNCALFVYELLLGAELRDFMMQWGLVPQRITLALRYGDEPLLGVALTPLTSMFLHGGWLHLIGNMWYLWIFGDNVEDRLGHGRFIVFYLMCGIVAAFGQIFMDPASTLPTIGASGAIAGVMGAYFVLYPQSRVLTLIPLFIFWEIIELPAIVLLGFWFLIQLFSAGAIAVTAQTGGGGVAFMAHVAGFITGMLAVFVFRKRREPDLWY